MRIFSAYGTWFIRSAAVVTALSAAWFVLAVFTADFSLEENVALEQFGDSSLQFGFNQYHTGAISAPLSVESYSSKSVFYPARGVSSQWPTPIYVNGQEARVAPFEGRQVLIYGARRELIAWDVVNDELLWRVSDLRGQLYTAPYLDLETGRIYFVTVRWVRREKPETAQGVFEIRHWINSVSLEGADLHTIELDIPALLAHEHGKFTEDPSSFLHCKTALGVNKHTDPNYVFFGCSMVTSPSIGLHYGHMKGSRGVLVRAYLDDDNHITASGLGGFTPSMPTSNPHSGFDGGIYNIGSGPVVLDDGSILVAIGNGPFLPDEQNYGCSIVRLNGATLRPEAKRQGGYEYYSSEDGEFNECHGSNIDASSSSPVVIEQDGHHYAAITGKDGYLKVFDPFDLPGQEQALKHEFHLGGQAHGQPAIWKSGDGEIRVNVVGRRQFEPLLQRELVLASQETRGRLANTYEELACIGLLPSTMGDGRLPINVYYSGPFRNDYVNLVAADQPEQGDQYFGRDPLPYRYQFAVGWIDSAPAASGPPGYVYEPLNVYGDKAPGYTRKVGYFNATPASVPENLANEVNIVGTAGYVLVDTESGGCGSYEGSSYKRVYLLSRTTAYSPAALFASFVINPDYTISQRWIRTTDERFDVQNMSPLVVMPTDEHETPLMIFAIHEVARGQGASTLMIVNADTGETVDEIPFSGRARSTIPIIIGDDIVLTTRDRGLVFFADGTGWLSRHSSGLFSNVPSRIRAYLEQ